MRLRQDYLKESPGQYAHGECYRKHFFVPHKFTVWNCNSKTNGDCVGMDTRLKS